MSERATPAPRTAFAPWKDGSSKPIVRFENVVKRFGDFVAVKELTFDIFEREFFALLGPSGCGKTTLLRMLAGFEKPSSGRILLAGEDISRLPPHKRPVNMMFQSYALFPHMSVERNVGFGLRQDGMPKDEIAARVADVLSMVELGKFANRKPHQLSGGQQQRVALARALAKSPRILLLDEPLGALDKRLRTHTQFELMELQERTGITFIIVTHDQEEAMTVASRIAVMDHGELVQVAPPGELYENPNSRYVANFIGDVNMFETRVSRADNGMLDLEWAGKADALRAVADVEPAAGTQVWLALRPEKLGISKDKPAAGVNAIAGTVEDIGYLGSISHYHVRLDNGQRVTALQANATHRVASSITWEDEVWLSWTHDAGVVLTK